MQSAYLQPGVVAQSGGETEWVGERQLNIQQLVFVQVERKSETENNEAHSGKAITDGRELKSYFGRVFNFQLGSLHSSVNVIAQTTSGLNAIQLFLYVIYIFCALT